MSAHPSIYITLLLVSMIHGFSPSAQADDRPPGETHAMPVQQPAPIALQVLQGPNSRMAICAVQYGNPLMMCTPVVHPFMPCTLDAHGGLNCELKET